MQEFDYKHPDYAPIIKHRLNILNSVRNNPAALEAVKLFYKENPAQFICDFGFTYDPRQADLGRTTSIPFLLFPKQIEWTQWVVEHWRSRKHGITEKSRESGMSWLAIALACTLCIFNPGISIGFGSRKEDFVDKIGDLDSLFEKARFFVDNLPLEFRGGYDRKTSSKHMTISFPDSGSLMKGEAGDNIGRGGRQSIYFIDEAQPMRAKILTPSGWRYMSEINVGDKVIGSNGNQINVVGINLPGSHPVYRFTMSDGTQVESSSNHLWTVDKVWGKKSRITIRTKDIADKYLYKSIKGQTQYIYRIPKLTSPVDYGINKIMPINPYLLGSILGDGCISKTRTGISFSSADIESIEYIKGLMTEGYNIKHTGKYEYRISHVNGRGANKRGLRLELLESLKELKIYGCRSWEKFIPEIYMFSSVDDRLELIRGLMDTDGSSSDGAVTFHSSSCRLRDQLVELCRSLGGICTTKTKPDHRGYRDIFYAYISMPENLNPFRLRRKAEKFKSRKHDFSKTIVNVELIEAQEVKCISVDSDDNMYVTDGFTLTHNCAFLERPLLTEASLSQTTNCRMDISTPNGMSNPFAEKRHSGKIDVFTFHWRDDPRKDEAWYKKQLDNLDDVTIAQEIDINYAASVEGVLIRSEWIQSAIDAHIKLGIDVTGGKYAALDVADEGRDNNAIALRHGILLKSISEWSGKGSDIHETACKAVHICDENGVRSLIYDSDGLGAGIKGSARVINESRIKHINSVPFRGSATPIDPEVEYIEGRLNKDFFGNLKAQSWWLLRKRFEKTYNWRTKGVKCSPDDIISIDSSLPNLNKLIQELSQPTYLINNTGKIMVDKTPEGMKSPNLADSVMMVFSKIIAKEFVISNELLHTLGALKRRR